jgi:hypothetical protein
MKLSKGKFNKLLLKNKQTKKQFKNNKNINNHCNTFKNRKIFNLKNKTLKDLSTVKI